MTSFFPGTGHFLFESGGMTHVGGLFTGMGPTHSRGKWEIDRVHACGFIVPGSRWSAAGPQGPAGTWPSGSQPMKTKKKCPNEQYWHTSVWEDSRRAWLRLLIKGHPPSFCLSFSLLTSWIAAWILGAPLQPSISAWVKFFFFYIFVVVVVVVVLGNIRNARVSLKERRKVWLNRRFMDYFFGSRACQRSAEVRKRVSAAQTAVKSVQLTDAVANRQAGKRLHMQARDAAGALRAWRMWNFCFPCVVVIHVNRMHARTLAPTHRHRASARLFSSPSVWAGQFLAFFLLPKS